MSNQLVLFGPHVGRCARVVNLDRLEQRRQDARKLRPHAAPIQFECLDCGVDTSDAAEYYMVRDDVWLAANSANTGMLCIGCLEDRLGRQLTPFDFIPAPVNMPQEHPMSRRLLHRLGYREGLRHRQGFREAS